MTRDKQGDAVWYLPAEEDGWEAGWYAVPLQFERLGMLLYTRAIERACRKGCAGSEEIEAELRA